MTTKQKNILQVKGLKKYFPVYGGFFRKKVADLKAVDDVSFTIREGETLGLVGESGCGKTTVGRNIVRLYEPTAGHILYSSQLLGENQGKQGQTREVDLPTLAPQDMKIVRREMQMVFQDPNSSLNPRMTVQDIIAEAFYIHNFDLSKSELEERVVELLRSVGLRAEYRNRYPHQFSGGQKQRIGIARALSLKPRLIVLDEPVSALDVSVQGQVLNLLEELQDTFGLTYLFIAHNLAVVEHISDRIAVMYLGRIVELASSEELYANPLHPYSEALLSAVPIPDPDIRQDRIILEGGIPSPIDPPPGCPFHTRCRFAEEKCKQSVPTARELQPDHFVACHRAEELSLKGIKPWAM